MTASGMRLFIWDIFYNITIIDFRYSNINRTKNLISITPFTSIITSVFNMIL